MQFFLRVSLIGSVLIAAFLLIFIKMSGGHNLNAPLSDKRVREVTNLYSEQASRIERPTKEEEISELVKNHDGRISIGGGHYSQGGQVMLRNSLHLDMRGYNKVVEFKPEDKKVTVQAGITWRDLQEVIDKENLSVQIMQTYANFTVGGSLSVNVHGRYLGKGPVIGSVESFTLVTADGEVISASPQDNSGIFYGAIGGYGGLGVISEVTLKLDDNVKVERKVKELKIKDYKDHFFKNIRGNKKIVFTNADIYPPDYEDVLDISWYKTDKELTHQERMIPKGRDYPLQPYLVELVAGFDFGKWIRKNIFDPSYYSSERVVWRNWEASYDVKELEPSSREDKTYVLREYFVPVERFDDFYPRMKDIFNKNDVNIINVSIRHANKDPGSILAWAKSEVFAFVVYYQQETSEEARSAVKKWTREMVDLVIDVGGAYYLPYQPHATQKQFAKVYPRHQEFFDLKKRLDPQNKFSNKLWDKYYPANQGKLRDQISALAQYYRGEEQTFLTVPEWYLVFNPKEYADFLMSGKSPSDFPFFASIDEYWSLYDKVTFLTSKAYPENGEYMTMLQVIGVSTTVEYLIKGIYENTIGRFFAFTANDNTPKEEKIIAKANKAYSDFIYHTAWYEFEFSPWVKKVWGETSFFGENFLRKTERKLFFTAEFLVKSVYAELIGLGAKTAYEASDKLIYAVISGEGELPESVELLAEEDGKKLIGIPRWGPFTEIVPKLVGSGYQFIEISGNDEILVSGIFKSKLVEPLASLKLFESQVVTILKSKRHALLVPIQKLHSILPEIEKQGVLEHLYDY